MPLKALPNRSMHLGSVSPDAGAPHIATPVLVLEVLPHVTVQGVPCNGVRLVINHKLVASAEPHGSTRALAFWPLATKSGLPACGKAGWPQGRHQHASRCQHEAHLYFPCNPDVVAVIQLVDLANVHSMLHFHSLLYCLLCSLLHHILYLLPSRGMSSGILCLLSLGTQAGFLLPPLLPPLCACLRGAGRVVGALDAQGFASAQEMLDAIAHRSHRAPAHVPP